VKITDFFLGRSTNKDNSSVFVQGSASAADSAAPPRLRPRDVHPEIPPGRRKSALPSVEMLARTWRLSDPFVRSCRCARGLRSSWITLHCPQYWLSFWCLGGKSSLNENKLNRPSGVQASADENFRRGLEDRGSLPTANIADEQRNHRVVHP